MIPKDIKKKIGDLPFVQYPERGQRVSDVVGHMFWSVRPTGDYYADYEQGYQWSRLLLPFLEHEVGGALVSWIIAAMIEVGEINGITAGFSRGLADLDSGVKHVVRPPWRLVN
jgi:hypothetical protein